MLSYRRETALQGTLLLTESGRLELGDNILLTLYVCLQPRDIIGSKAIEFGEKCKIRASQIISSSWI